MANKKLNPKGKDIKGNIVAVAAKHDRQLARSGNGNLQFVKTARSDLYAIITSTLYGRDTYYNSGDQIVARLKQQIDAVVNEEDGPDFIANLIIHARTEMHIRTIPIVATVHLAKSLRDQGKTFESMRRLVCDVITRADQITDMYAYSLTVFGDKKKVPMAIKRGVADAFNKFDEYQFAKYNRSNELKMRDVLRIVHPVAANVAQGEIFSRIMSDTLATPYTWETQLSENGQRDPKERKSLDELWTELFTSGKMGYMAQLRNLRNLEQNVSHQPTLKAVASVIADPDRVEKSKQLPFDFTEAYKAVSNSTLKTAVSRAIDHSVGNIPALGKNVWIIVDASGSMSGFPREMSTMFAAAIYKNATFNPEVENHALTVFGSKAHMVTDLDCNQSIFHIAQKFQKNLGATDFDEALQLKSKLGFNPDTVIVFTDNEIDDMPYGNLAYAFDDKCVKIAVNLEASVTTPFIRENGWYELAGWSTNMFKFVRAIRDKRTAVDVLSVPYGTVQY